jgi:nucleotide-binding universal stress UspA family protein
MKEIRGDGVVERILVAVDGSSESNAAVQMASRIAGALNAEVTLVHVVEIEELPTLIAEAEDKDHEEHGQLVLGSSIKLARAEGIDAKLVLRKGHPAGQILRFASEYKPNLIVMGSRGMTGAKGILMGSVSMSVSRKAACSVIIVRS